MDRIIPQPGQLPLVEDHLNTNRAAMIALGFLAQMLTGTGTVADGLACTPAATGLGVVISPGSILTQTVVDQNAYGTLAADPTDAVMKQGINLSATAFSLTAPATTGQSINYLVEVSFVEADTNAIVLPFYDAASPGTAWSGPSGGGAAVNTLRTQRAQLQVKAGVPANAGQQATPAVDQGWYGIWVITVNAGAVSIETSNIFQFPGAPFLPSKLSQIRKRCTAPLTLYVSNQGNDGWTGSTPNDPLLTLQQAVNVAFNDYDLAGNVLNIQVANGTYQGVEVAGYIINSQVNIVGNIANPSAVIISAPASYCVIATQCANVVLEGLNLTAPGGTWLDYATNGVAVLSNNASSVVIGRSIVFGECGYCHIYASLSSTVATMSPGADQAYGYTISGSAGYYHIDASNSGCVTIADAPITIENNPAFSAFAVVGECGQINAWGAAFTGTCTGARYGAWSNGVIDTNGGGADFFPGSTDGSSSAGGQYI